MTNRIQSSQPDLAAGRRRGGFTLTEVLISIALVLVLILGINQVFALTSRAVGAGQAVGAGTRAARGAQTIIAADAAAAVIERAPFLYIKGEAMAAFRNRQDLAADYDFSPTVTTAATVDLAVRTVDRDESGSDTDNLNDRTSRALLTRRTHRVDALKMFVAAPGRRQTGNGTSFSADVSSSEQYVCYGHLRQPNNTGPAVVTQGRDVGLGLTATSTTAQTPAVNPNNYFATDWILGRFAFMLRDPELVGGNHVIRDRNGNNMTYYARSLTATTSGSSATLSPFSMSSGTTVTGTPINTSEPIQSTLYDLIGMSMGEFRSSVLSKYTSNATDPPNNNPTNPGLAEWPISKFDFRPTGFAKAVRPLTRDQVSRTTPCFVEHCTQFVVEYAGDFLKQNADTGVVTDVCNNTGGGTDKEIDFVIHDPTTKQKTIRWYGFPRDTNNDGKIRAADGDVVPLRDLTPAGTPLPFERLANTKLPKATTDSGNYAYVHPSDPTQDGTKLGATYYAVWGPDTDGYPRPQMLRITMAIDDPAGRIAEEQYFTFVVQLP
jgi:prepilin-type N-terminal cleavage/methylation domain-containing protein